MVHHATNPQSVEGNGQHFQEDGLQDEDDNKDKGDKNYCSPFLTGYVSNMKRTRMLTSPLS